MLRYLMESCILFDYTVIYLFQGYYLILNSKKVPWNRKEKEKETELFYISGNWTFLYFGKGTFRTLSYLEPGHI